MNTYPNSIKVIFLDDLNERLIYTEYNRETENWDEIKEDLPQMSQEQLKEAFSEHITWIHSVLGDKKVYIELEII